RRLALVALLGSLVLPSFAHASDVIVQGTTDVRDAGLLDDVIIPGFQKSYPQYNLKFIAVGTGQALTNAEAGQGDAVLTHAPTRPTPARVRRSRWPTSARSGAAAVTTSPIAGRSTDSSRAARYRA